MEGGQSILPVTHGLTSVWPASSSSDVAPADFNDPPRPSRRHKTPNQSRPGVFSTIPTTPSPARSSMAAMAAQNPQVPEEKLGVPSRNPLPLSASQEAQVRDIFYQKVRKECAEEIKAFAACALGRTFTVSFACRAEHRVMNSCMKLHATQDAHDEAREEWFALRIERQRERERKTRVAHAQEEFMREWWGLPEHVRLSRQKEMEQRGERVHGLTAKDRPREKGQ